jgi:PIN domain nuclease of toxin-antitoxin system
VTPLLLDTHAWVWWVTRPDRLSRAQRTALERAQRGQRAPLLVSIISCWEVALLAEGGKLRFSIPTATWLEQAAALPGFDVVPLTLSVISNAVRLASLRDPADQLIVATAQSLGARVVTSDPRIGDSRLVPVVA